MPTLEQSPSPVVLQTSLPGFRFAAERSATYTTWASNCSWSAPTAERLRLDPANRHSRQGPRVDADFGLLVPALGRANHFITTDVDKMPLPGGIDRQELEGRTTLCRKTQVVPIECVVRGYLSGSGWAEYRKSGTVCGIRLPDGLQESSSCRNRSSRRRRRPRRATTRT